MGHPAIWFFPEKRTLTLVHDLEYHAGSLGSACLGGAIEIAGGVENQIAGGMVPVGSLPEIMDDFVRPTAAG